MATFLFAWNPNKWQWPADQLSKSLREVSVTGGTEIVGADRIVTTRAD